jgi:two-component system sensor histidine kinase AtoS
MHNWPPKTRIWRKPRFIPLQYRLIIVSSGLVTLLLVITALSVSYQQAKTIRDQVKRRGMAIAHSIAATSRSALTTYDYVALSQTANQAAQDPDLAYVIIHDKEGRVAGYSGRPDLEWKFLPDGVSQRAIASRESLVQNVMMDGAGAPVLDIAVPVTIPGSDRPWGVVRVALSLDPMYRQIREVQATIGGIGVLALLLAVLICIWSARRITNPIGILTGATVEAARGNLNQDVRIATGDEVEVLAENFSGMILEILQQRGEIEDRLLQITNLQRYLDKLLTTMNDGLLSVDMQGNLVTANPAACAILGIQEGAAATRPPIEDLLRGSPELVQYVKSSLAAPLSANQQELRLMWSADVRNVIVASSILVDENDAPQQVIFNIHDITELKKLEADFRQAERLAALGTLSAGMAHEIRNPLSAVKTFVQLLPRKLEKPGFLEKFQRTVPRELDRINRLVEDLLELAKAPKYRFILVDIRLTLLQAIELFEEQMLLHRITCHFDVPGSLPLVWASTDQLAKAFNNIVRNAIQAMPGGGELRVRTFTGSLPKDQIKPPPIVSQDSCNCVLGLVFSDSGIGMEPEDVRSAFNPFFTTKDSGTGLGLAITHKVITEHGGRIEVNSAPGKGTTFLIHLPARKS